LPESTGFGGAPGRVRGGARPDAHLGSICGLRRRRGSSGELGQQAQGGSGRDCFLTGELGGKARLLTTRESVLACGEELRGFVRPWEQAEGELAVGAPIAVRRLRKPPLMCTREGLVGRFIARGNTGE
jgi:hypothetical protein